MGNRLAISGDYRFSSRGYRFTLDGVTPKTAKGRTKFEQYTVASA